MDVPFYGHVRQYQNIKDEIDAKIQEVIFSGQYVQGPMLKKFEAELAVLSLLSEDHREGARAFLEKRPPNWTR